MASQGFTDDLKHVAVDLAVRSRDRLAGLRRSLRSGVGWLVTLPPPAKLGIVAFSAGAMVLAAALTFQPEPEAAGRRPFARTASVAADAVASRHVTSKSPAAESPQPARGDSKSAAQRYAAAAQKGDRRAFKKLVALTRAPSCGARSEAADALGNVRGAKSTAALKKLAASTFRDESKSPGIFSCSSRRAALKALEKQKGG